MDNELPDLMDAAARSAGMSGVISIVVVLVCIWAAWWALQGFRFDVFLKQPKSPQARLLTIMVAVVLGYQAAKFIMDYFVWSSTLKWLF